jgi:hypothetical protein
MIYVCFVYWTEFGINVHKKGTTTPEDALCW